jgi:hypothetical protein
LSWSDCSVGKGFRGFAPEFVVLLPGEACRVKRPGGGQG